MDKIITKTIPASELRNALMGFGYEKYIIKRIELIERSNDYLISLKTNG